MKSGFQIAFGAAVELRLIEWRAHPALRPDPEQDIACLECNGAGIATIRGQAQCCGECAGRGRLKRKSAWAQYIATHGDELQYGGRHCKRAFAVLVDSVALLIEHVEDVYRGDPLAIAYYRAHLLALSSTAPEVVTAEDAWLADYRRRHKNTRKRRRKGQSRSSTEVHR